MAYCKQAPNTMAMSEQHPAITWTNVDLSSVGPCTIYLKAVALEMLVKIITNHNTFENYQSKMKAPFLRDNELIMTAMFQPVLNSSWVTRFGLWIHKVFVKRVLGITMATGLLCLHH